MDVLGCAFHRVAGHKTTEITSLDVSAHQLRTERKQLEARKILQWADVEWLSNNARLVLLSEVSLSGLSTA